MVEGDGAAANGGAVSVDAARAALDAFVVDNDELAELEALVGRFNVFEALGVVRQEIRHSAFLAWLLDPSGSHGQGALFLRGVLMDVLRRTPAELRPLSPVDLDGVDLRGVRVRREWNRVDVLIVCEEPAFAVAIENKVDAGEHGDQLERYERVVDGAFADRRRLYVFLTREGDEASRERWTAYSYGMVHDVLERVLRRAAGSIGDDVAVFVEHYVAVLRSRFMDDPAIDALVEKIYARHRVALDIIFERKGDPRRRIVDAFAGVLSARSFEWKWHATGTRCAFAPASWESVMPGVAKWRVLSPHALVRGIVRVLPARVEFYVVMPPMTDPHVREAMLEIVGGPGEGLGFKLPKNTEARGIRVVSKRVFKLGDDGGVGDELDAWMEGVADDAERMLDGVTALMQERFGVG